MFSYATNRWEGFKEKPHSQSELWGLALNETQSRYKHHTALILQSLASISSYGRKMTPGFINYWEGVQPQSPEYLFARKMVDTPKVVFSKTLTRVDGKALRLTG